MTMAKAAARRRKRTWEVIGKFPAAAVQADKKDTELPSTTAAEEEKRRGGLAPTKQEANKMTEEAARSRRLGS